MKNTLAKYAISSVAAAILAANASAGTVTSDGADIKIKTKGGLSVETTDGDFSFQLGGRIQAQFDQYSDSMNLKQGGDTANDLFIRRARIYVKGTLYSDWAYKAQFNIDSDGSKGGSYEDLYIKWTKFKMANVTVGNHKEPFSLQELTSSKYVTTVERAAIDDFLSEGRSLGVSIGGATNAWGYAIGLYDTDKENNSGKSLWAVTGRAFASPINNEDTVLHIGAGFSQRDGSDSTDPFNGGSVTQGIKKGNELNIDLVDDADGQTLYNIEAAARFGAFHASTEYHVRKTDAVSGGTDAEVNGYYVQGGWFITGEARPYKKGAWNKVKPNNKGIGAWELFARFEGLNGDDEGISEDNRNKGTIFTAGANWYANDSIRVSANYVQSNWDKALDETLNIADEDSLFSEDSGRGFAIRVQVAY
ncbi:MAG: porin [Pseudomonadales bacterium]